MPFVATNFVDTVPRSKSLGEPILNLLGGSVNTLGSMKRAVASVAMPVVAASIVHAAANALLNKPPIRAKGINSATTRRLRRPASGAGADNGLPATGFEGAGLAGIGGATAGLAGLAA